MSPLSACSRVLRRYAVFSGRASRAEFWWWWLAISVVWTALVVVPALAAGTIGPLDLRLGPFGGVTLGQLPVFSATGDGVADDPGWSAVVATAWLVLTVIPTVAVASRRLHDGGFPSAWLLLVLLVPGPIVLMVMLAWRSRESGGRFDRLGDRRAQRPAVLTGRRSLRPG
jgi:uncharacterized membrane protein YhaH (DUF805 family)